MFHRLDLNFYLKNKLVSQLATPGITTYVLFSTTAKINYTNANSIPEQAWGCSTAPVECKLYLCSEQQIEFKLCDNQQSCVAIILDLSLSVYCWWCPLFNHNSKQYRVNTHCSSIFSLFLLCDYVLFSPVSESSFLFLIFTWQCNEQHLELFTILCCKLSIALLTIHTYHI